MVNSEVDQPGNYVLSAWQFESGTLQGIPLRGLTLALLEKSDQNLADAGTRAHDAMVYLPPNLTPAQRSALLAWARQNTAAKLDEAHVKIAPLQVSLAEDKTCFSAGSEIIFTGGTPTACNVGGCGEMLWYQPRSRATSFTVDELGQSRIIEPALSVRWMDHGRRTLFVGRFGDPEPTIPALCGAAKTASL